MYKIQLATVIITDKAFLFSVVDGRGKVKAGKSEAPETEENKSESAYKRATRSSRAKGWLLVVEELLFSVHAFHESDFYKVEKSENTLVLNSLKSLVTSRAL